jgi:predicted dehydrogenase
VLGDPAVQLVVVATPPSTHAAIGGAVIDAGRHVVIEKPFTVTLAEARDLSERAAARRVVLSAFHNRRWDADFLTLRRIVGEGVLGETMYVESHFDRYRPAVRDRWREREEPGAGLWYDLGSHLVDQAVQLFGEPAALWADLAAQRQGSTVADYFHVVLLYGGGRRVVLHGSSLVLVPGPRFVAHGTRGSFVKHGLDTQESALAAGVRPGAPGWGIDPVAASVQTAAADGTTAWPVQNAAGDYRQYYEGIRDAIGAGAPNPVPAADACTVVRLLEAAVASSRAGRAATLRHP